MKKYLNHVGIAWGYFIFLDAYFSLFRVLSRLNSSDMRFIYFSFSGYLNESIIDPYSIYVVPVKCFKPTMTLESVVLAVALKLLFVRELDSAPAGFFIIFKVTVINFPGILDLV